MRILIFFATIIGVALAQEAGLCPPSVSGSSTNPDVVGACGDSQFTCSRIFKGRQICCRTRDKGACVTDPGMKAFIEEEVRKEANAQQNNIPKPTPTEYQQFSTGVQSYTGQGATSTSRTFNGLTGGQSIMNFAILSSITGGELFPTCPVDVPYCHRTKCGGPRAEQDYLTCVSNPKCCFDFKVFIYKQILGNRFMGNTPNCYHGATSELYGRVRQLFPTGMSVWLLGKPIVKIFHTLFDSKLLNINNQLACRITTSLGNIGKRVCGWRKIKEDECALRACCWNAKANNGQGECVYPEKSVMQFSGAYDTYPELYSDDGTNQQCPNPFSLREEAYKRLPCRHEFPKFDKLSELLFWCPQQDCCDNLLAGTGSFGLAALATGGGGGAGGLGGALSGGLLGGGAGGNLLSGTSGILALSSLTGGGGGNTLSSLFLGSALTGGGFGGNTSPAGLAGLFALTGNSDKITDIFCPYYFLKLVDLPDISKNTEGCCEIPICSHKKIASGIRRASLTQWSAFGPCQPSCGSGQQTRTRSCIYNNNQLAPVSECSNVLLEESQPCQGPPCFQPPYYGEWEQWSACSRPCDGGTQSSLRRCYSNNVETNPSQCTSLGSSEQTRSCNNQPCQSYKWGSWRPDGACSSTCTGGTRTYRRQCQANDGSIANPTNCGQTNNVITVRCGTGPCATWGSWEDWGECSVNCGPGQKTRVRMCYNNGVSVDPNQCGPDFSETIPCNERACGPQVNPLAVTIYVTQWESSSDCDCSGTKFESRTCWRRESGNNYSQIDTNLCASFGVQVQRTMPCNPPNYC